jgi:hypothetical protein
MDHIKFTFVMVAFILIGCQNNAQNNKESHGEKHKSVVPKEIDIHDCTTITDTVFKDNDYIKYISLNNKQYGVEIKLSNVVDTLDFRFDCNVVNGIIPKLVFKDKMLLLSQGSGFNYRNAILCTLDKTSNKISIEEFETEIVDSSEYDLLVFTQGDMIFLFNRNNRELLYKALPREYHNLKFSNSEILEGKVTLIFKENKSLEFAIKDFKLKEKY